MRARPPVGAHDPDGLLAVAAAKAQLGRAEQAVDDQDVLIDAAVDDLGSPSEPMTKIGGISP
jgi:hypothetical protein